MSKGNQSALRGSLTKIGLLVYSVAATSGLVNDRARPKKASIGYDDFCIMISLVLKIDLIQSTMMYFISMIHRFISVFLTQIMR